MKRCLEAPFLSFRASFRALLLIVLVVVASGCQSQITVRINEDLDGTGDVTVTLLLDREAVEAAGDFRAVLRMDDLQAAGWATAGPVPRPPGGFVAYTATKSFRNSGEAQLIFEELTGPEGAFSGLVIDRTRSPLRIVTSLRGTVDLSKGYQQFGDDGIAQVFQSDSALGVTPEEIADRYGKPLDQLVTLRMEVAFPNADVQTIELPVSQQIPVSIRQVVWNRLILFPLIAAGVGLFGLIIALRRGRRY
jgi:hypothetical protein